MKIAGNQKRRRRKKRTNTPGAEAAVAVVIETPKGSRNKFKYDPGSHMFKLSKSAAPRHGVSL
jgi:hypothetical protein